eukprot:jgi/Astpho2/2460/Aster-x1077
MTAIAEDVMELDIKVQGMTCHGCTSRVQDTIQGAKHAKHAKQTDIGAGQTQWWLAGAAFMPATTFQGHRAGYVFQLGLSGLGYYTDPRCASNGPRMI